MPIKLDIVNPINYPSWNSLLALSPNATIFHSSDWAKVLHESYNYKPIYFSLIQNNRLKALIPFMEVKSILTGKRGVALPFTDYCDPILSEDIPHENIFLHLSKYGKEAGWKYIEIRGNGGLFHDISSSSFYYGHVLGLTPGEKEIYSRFKDTIQRNIKKAIKENVGVSINTSAESIREFYRLHCMTRKEHGLPPQPFRFFQKIHEYIISQGHGFIALATHSGRVIAGAIYLHFGEKAIYKYGASDRKYQHLRPNNLVMWEAIKWYAQNGFKELCFGRTEPENQGLLQFKRGWGTDEKIIKYFRYSVNKKRFIESNSSNNTGLHTGIFRAMPIPLSRAIGKVLYKHMG